MFWLAPVRRRAAARHRGGAVRRASPARLPVLGAISAATAAMLLGGRFGALLASPLAAAVALLTRRWSRVAAADRAPDTRAVAFLLDLLASVLAAGAPPELAIAGVTAAVREHGDEALKHAVEPLSRVGRLLQLGSEPAVAWAWLHPIPGYGSVADCGRRCAASGARLAGALAAVADDLRVRHQVQALARAERVGVWSLLPLGCCFLPAFVCLGVIPVILGVAGQVLSVVPT
jgi:pilus assembly protein TadC